ncbi:MAG: nitroreductase family protein [Lentisphaeria bacterium]|jgi:nitroreductase
MHLHPKLDLIFARRSIRTYAPDAVPDGTVHDLLEAAMAAPSACAKDPWRFVVVRDRARLAAIAAGLPNGKMLATAPLGIAVCGDLDAAHDRQLSFLLQDCAAAIENLLLAASALGLGGCWLGVHPREERIALLRRELRLPPSFLPVAMVALGQPGEAKEPRTRFHAAHVRQEAWLP